MATTLPLDILDLIFSFAVSSSASSSSDSPTLSASQQYSNFSLISSHFTYAAQARLINSIEIRNLSQLSDILINLKSNKRNELGSLIRNLRLGKSGSSISTPSTPALAEAQRRLKGGGTIKEGEFIELCKGLPELLSIKLHRLACYHFDDFLSQGSTSLSSTTLSKLTITTTTIPLFPNLQYLNLTTEPHDEEQGLLRYVITNAPSLNSLHLTSTHRGPYSIATPILLDTFPPIKNFTVTGPYYEYLLFSPHQPLFPLSFYKRLEHLDVEGKVDWKGFEPILKEVGSGLRSLRLRSITKAVDLIKSLPYLTRLDSLQTTTLISLPVNFLQLIPGSLTILKVLITRSSLEDFKLHPRDELKLVEMWLPDNDIEAMKFLPSSVEKVVYRQGWPSRVFQFLENSFERPLATTSTSPTELNQSVSTTSTTSSKDLSAVKSKLDHLQLEEIVLPKYRALDKEWENDVARFKKIGVRLTSGQVLPREGDII